MNWPVTLAFVSIFCYTQAVFDCAKYDRQYPQCRCESESYGEITCYIDEENVVHVNIRYHPEDGTMFVDCGMFRTLKQCSEHFPEICLNSNLTINYFTIVHHAISVDDISFSELLSKFDTDDIMAPNKSQHEKHISSNGLILSGADSVYSHAYLRTHERYSRIEWFHSNETSIDVIRQSFVRNNTISILEFNNYLSIPFDSFSELKNLTELYYWDYKNMTMKSADFNALENLVTLGLSKNNITKELPYDIFYFLNKLENVIMVNNTFNAFPKNLFKNNKGLKNVQLRQNDVKKKNLPNTFLSDLPNLENVDLSHSALQILPFDTFHNSPNLCFINLSNNNIKTLNRVILKDAVNLVKLDLSFNVIKSLSSIDIFKSLIALQELNLNNNFIEVLESEYFMKNEEMKSILLSQNKIHTINCNFLIVSRNLEIIDLSFNNLDFNKTSFSPFYPFENLLDINLSHNKISNYDIYWSKSEALQSLDLSFNNIQSISLADFHYDQFTKSRKITIDIRHNTVANILEYHYYPYMQPIESTEDRRLVLVGSNPFDCDCIMFDFIKYLKGSRGEKSHTIVELAIDDAQCATPKSKEGKPLIELDEQELTCDLDRDEAECPDSCSCSYQPHAFVVDCENRNLGYVPQITPRTLYIGGKRFVETKAYELHLEHNNITHLIQFDASVTKLFLKGNQLSGLPLGTIPPNIMTLDLRENNIETLPNEVMFSLTNETELEELYLSGNPFSCNCFDSRFITILQTNQQKIPDYDYLSCADGRLISGLTALSLCGTTIIVGGLIGITLFGISISAAVCYYFQRKNQKLHSKEQPLI